MKFFDTAISLEFEKFEGENLEFLEDFNRTNLGVNKWKKLAAKVDFSEGEEMIFKMLLELKNEILELKKSGEKKLKLKQKAMICAMNFEGFKLAKNLLEINATYYAKFSLESQSVKLFFIAKSQNEGEIYEIKKEDKMLLDGFVVEIQRQNILKSKGEKNE